MAGRRVGTVPRDVRGVRGCSAGPGSAPSGRRHHRRRPVRPRHCSRALQVALPPRYTQRAHHCMWASGIRTACAYRHGHGHGDMGMGMGMGMGLWAWRWHGMAWHGSALHAHCMCTHACALTHDRCMGTACACFVQAAWRYSRATRSDPRERAFKSPSAAHPNHCSPIGIPGCDRSLCPGCRCISRYGWAALKAIDLDAAHLIRATGEPVTRISLRSLGGGNLTPAPVR